MGSGGEGASLLARPSHLLDAKLQELPPGEEDRPAQRVQAVGAGGHQVLAGGQLPVVVVAAWGTAPIAVDGAMLSLRDHTFTTHALFHTVVAGIQAFLPPRPFTPSIQVSPVTISKLTAIRRSSSTAMNRRRAASTSAAAAPPPAARAKWARSRAAPPAVNSLSSEFLEAKP